VSNHLTYSYNSASPTAKRYSILNTLASQTYNGVYEFKMVWSNKQVQHWKQTTNPLSITGATNPSGYQAISVPYTYSSFSGLRKSGGSALLDGSPSSWWHALGSYSPYSGGGIPGPGTVVAWVELYSRQASPCRACPAGSISIAGSGCMNCGAGLYEVTAPTRAQTALLTSTELVSPLPVRMVAQVVQPENARRPEAKASATASRTCVPALEARQRLEAAVRLTTSRNARPVATAIV
jgi:hypothetical protein